MYIFRARRTLVQLSIEFSCGYVYFESRQMLISGKNVLILFHRRKKNCLQTLRRKYFCSNSSKLCIIKSKKQSADSKIPFLGKKPHIDTAPKIFFLLISISLWATLDVYSKNSSLITYIMIRRPIFGALHSIISSFVSMEMKMQIPSFKIRWDATQRYQFFSIKDFKIYALLRSE